jgi:hypothetical protein
MITKPPIYKSQKFWIAVSDMVAGLAIFFVGKYAPVYIEDLATLWLYAQPVLLIWIASIAAEDVAAKRSK